MSLTVCLSAWNTLTYPKGGGHLWAYLNWALGLRALGCRAYATAADGPAGPVHVNLPLREPLAPAAEQLDAEDWEGRGGGMPS